jgi:outer membrane protein OmpA-like peptidoglycan-associated protein
MRKTILLALVAVMLAAPGCASKKYVRKEQETTNQRIDAVEQSVEEVESRTKRNEEAIASTQEDLSQTKKTMGAEVAEAKRMARGKLLYQVVLNNDAIRFATNQAELTDTGVSLVRDLVTKLKSENKNVYVEIEGHTDNTGDTKYNYELGIQRAEAVRRFMAGEGIPLHKIGVISYGETMPVGDNSTVDGRAKNRRVVILVLE